jgi:hypothetical protein
MRDESRTTKLRRRPVVVRPACDLVPTPPVISAGGSLAFCRALADAQGPVEHWALGSAGRYDMSSGGLSDSAAGPPSGWLAQLGALHLLS